VIAQRGAFVLLVGIAAIGCRAGKADADASANASAKADAKADADAKANASAKADADAKAGRARVAARVPGIAYAAVNREREVVSGGVGLATLEPRADVSEDTVFEAASIAKTVIATCVMQLAEEGRLDLDADAGKYVGFKLRHPRSGDPITVRMLLTHRGSIVDRDDELLAGADVPLASFLQRYLVDDRGPRALAFLDAGPGSTTAYSNVGAALAALAVERISGEGFVDFTRRRLFVPLGMKSTGWRAPRPEHAATPHALRDGGFVALPQASHAVYPVVDLRSSAHDLARFARAILREGELDGTRILAPPSIRTMLSADARDGDQALAWQLRTIGGQRVTGHEGEDAGATTALFLDLAAGTGAVVLANGDAFVSGDRDRAGAIQGLIASLLECGGTSPPRPPNLARPASSGSRSP
jgi:CubicO group peptidase (beta-lactamase class C family)